MQGWPWRGLNMLIEKRDLCSSGCDKMIDRSFEDGFVQLRRCCWESQKLFAFFVFAPLLPRLCTAPFVFACFFIPCFSWFTTSKVSREPSPRKFPVEAPDLQTSVWEHVSGCVSVDWRVPQYEVCCALCYLRLPFCFQRSAVLSALLSHLHVHSVKEQDALSHFVSLYLSSHTHTHLLVQACPRSRTNGCVGTAEYLIGRLYHHYCSHWLSASPIMTGSLLAKSKKCTDARCCLSLNAKNTC